MGRQTRRNKGAAKQPTKASRGHAGGHLSLGKVYPCFSDRPGGLTPPRKLPCPVPGGGNNSNIIKRGRRSSRLPGGTGAAGEDLASPLLPGRLHKYTNCFLLYLFGGGSSRGNLSGEGSGRRGAAASILIIGGKVRKISFPSKKFFGSRPPPKRRPPRFPLAKPLPGVYNHGGKKRLAA